MYPQIMMDLSGWNVRSMACGPSHYVVAADDSVITWGMGHNGELGYGPNGKKSSANPAKVRGWCGSVEARRCERAGKWQLKWQGAHAYCTGQSGYLHRDMACRGKVAIGASYQRTSVRSCLRMRLVPYLPHTFLTPHVQCEPVEGMRVHQVAAGAGFTLMLANPDDKKLEKLPVYETSAPAEEATGAAAEEGEAGEAWAVDFPSGREGRNEQGCGRGGGGR